MTIISLGSLRMNASPYSCSNHIVSSLAPSNHSNDFHPDPSHGQNVNKASARQSEPRIVARKSNTNARTLHEAKAMT